jgi:DinB superfamily
MTTNDGVLAAAQGVLALALTEMRRCIEDGSPDALNWRPGRNDTNSLAVLVVHSLASTRSWLARAMGAPLPLRDRASEFATTATDPEALLAHFDEMSHECTATARPAGASRLGRDRWLRRGSGGGSEVGIGVARSSDV